MGDNGKENGNYYSMLGLCKDNGKENGNWGCECKTENGGLRPLLFQAVRVEALLFVHAFGIPQQMRMHPVYDLISAVILAG